MYNYALPPSSPLKEREVEEINFNFKDGHKYVFSKEEYEKVLKTNCSVISQMEEICFTEDDLCKNIYIPRNHHGFYMMFELLKHFVIGFYNNMDFYVLLEICIYFGAEKGLQRVYSQMDMNFHADPNKLNPLFVMYLYDLFGEIIPGKRLYQTASKMIRSYCAKDVRRILIPDVICISKGLMDVYPFITSAMLEFSFWEDLHLRAKSEKTLSFGFGFGYMINSYLNIDTKLWRYIPRKSFEPFKKGSLFHEHIQKGKNVDTIYFWYRNTNNKKKYWPYYLDKKYRYYYRNFMTGYFSSKNNGFIDGVIIIEIIGKKGWMVHKLVFDGLKLTRHPRMTYKLSRPVIEKFKMKREECCYNISHGVGIAYVDELVFIIGNCSTRVIKLDLNNRKVSLVSPTLFPRGVNPSIIVRDRRIYVYGGKVNKIYKESEDAPVKHKFVKNHFGEYFGECYCIDTDEWTPMNITNKMLFKEGEYLEKMYGNGFQFSEDSDIFMFLLTNKRMLYCVYNIVTDSVKEIHPIYDTLDTKWQRIQCRYT